MAASAAKVANDVKKEGAKVAEKAEQKLKSTTDNISKSLEKAK